MNARIATASAMDGCCRLHEPKREILMYRTCLWSFVAAASLAVPAQAHDASRYVASARQTYNLNPEWRMTTGDVAGAQAAAFDDSGWKTVTLPNAFNEKEAFSRDIRDLSTGISWYRKHITLPSRPAGKAFLEFEGVRQAAEVWVNGKSVILSENGVMAFGADITAELRPGVNVIAVRVDNDWQYKERATKSGYQWNDRNFNANYGGITKNVRLHLTPEIYQTLPLYSGLGTTGQYVWADAFDLAGRAATIHAETQVRNDGKRPRHIGYRVEVRDRDGKVVARFDGETATIKSGQTAVLKAGKRLSDLHFWSWGYGYLYTVTTSLVERGEVLDSVDTITGFRQTGFANGMIELNGRVIQIHGYAQRTSNEWPAVGVSVPPWISDFSNGLMVESGGNLVRWMHITPSKQDIESADRVGLLQAMPAGDSEKDAKGRWWSQRTEVMRDAIIYNRNSPSIIFIESGNKGISEEHMAEMKAIRDRYDPHGGRAIGSREMLDSKVAEYGGEMLYINKSAGKPLWATEYSRDEAARAYQDEYTPPRHKDEPDYNRNQDSQAIEDVRRWYEYYRVRPGTGRRVSSGGVNIVFSDTNTHYRGDNNYRRSGEVDAVRLPKEGFYAHKVMWSDWVDSRTPGTHIVGHWNYPAGTRKDVHVISNGEAVELFLNGRSLGKGEQSDGFHFIWKDVAFEPGTLRAVATHANGKMSDARVETAGDPVAIRLTPRTSPRGFVMDGADIALVDVEVVDAKGRRVPVANDRIHFELEGPAEWRGGIAQGDSSGRPRRLEPVPGHDPRHPGRARDEDNMILSRDLPVENGINRVLLRAGTSAGRIRLRATATGLKDAVIAMEGVPVVAAEGGLSRDFPEDHQEALLTRGPTPDEPTYTSKRATHLPVRVSTPSNSEDARQSYDDNEETSWASDGRPSNAWIEYAFDKPETFNAIDFKLTGWRSRSYPLRISVDGKMVWEGMTERSLGYVGIDFPAVEGRTVRVTLVGETGDHDAFAKIQEVDSRRNAGDTGAEKVSAGWKLGIVEADFHGPVGKGSETHARK